MKSNWVIWIPSLSNQDFFLGGMNQQKMPMSKPGVLQWSSKKRPQRDKNASFGNHGRKRHFPPEPSIVGVSLKKPLEGIVVQKMATSMRWATFVCWYSWSETGLPNVSNGWRKVFFASSVPWTATWRNLDDIFWWSENLDMLTSQDSIVANQGWVWDSRSPKKLFQKSWWWRGNRKPHAGWGGVDPAYNWYFG